jgi:hypothetical protein
MNNMHFKKSLVPTSNKQNAWLNTKAIVDIHSMVLAINKMTNDLNCSPECTNVQAQKGQ